ncbi:S41 family peptidase [Clostridioides mangenotii]|uniref:S41 family peptidase n=1 Tax=Metaclostridioides mangenotii TaxID=1540 RepID=UPI001C1188B3|nr:S41 family peptidase [Clostridioides mangenotii]MBU5308600.1 S41 family peptidase [Clostridioides mangenotii]MCR1954961.1 S41 family peptidase [Clostridioides mangenotii]
MISKKKALLIAIVLVVLTALTTSTVTLALGDKVMIERDTYEQYKKYNKLLALESVIKEDYYKKPNDESLVDGAIKGLFAGTEDRYSTYYTKEEMNRLMEENEGSYVGVGMYIGSSEVGELTVIPMDGSPAQKGGIKEGDILVKVSGKLVSAKNSDEAVSLIKGKEGTTVDLVVKRDGKEKEFKIKREEIVDHTIEGKVVDDNLGYIKIKQFINTTYDDFDKELNKLKKKNIKGLVIDLRSNPGGNLEIVGEVADALIGEGTIVYTKDNKGNTEYIKSDKRKLGLPIVVLTNGESASASEILTAAIIDNKAGISVGTKTFGKGLVQSVKGLKDGTGYKLTTAQYFTPNGDYINEKGIKPTIEEKDESKQLDIAIEWLQKEIAK